MRSLPWVALAAVLATPAVATADEPDLAAAKQHYQAAEAAMSQGDYATAAREYGITYDLSKDPVLFFKLGGAFQKAGDCTAALAYYGRYLADGKPDDTFRTRTEAEMAVCRADAGATQPGAAAPAGEASSEDDAPAAPAPTERGEPPASLLDQPVTWQETAAWTSVGVSAALVTASAVFGLSAASREEDVQNLVDFRNAEGQPARFDGVTRERYEDLVDEGKSLERLSLIALGGAGVAAAAAAVFFLITPDDAPVVVAPSVSSDGAGVSAGWSF